MATLPTSPPTLPSASAICPDGTATTTTSASVASPPSRPTVVTAWSARSQRRASPPPTLPLPTTKMFTLPPRHWASSAAAQAGEDPGTTCRQPGPVTSACPLQADMDLAEVIVTLRTGHYQ